MSVCPPPRPIPLVAAAPRSPSGGIFMTLQIDVGETESWRVFQGLQPWKPECPQIQFCWSGSRIVICQLVFLRDVCGGEKKH